MDIFKIRVTMLGTTGVGKTALTAAMHEVFEENAGGYRLAVPNANERKLLRNWWTAITVFRGREWRRPAGSTQFEDISFVLQAQLEPILELKFVDYKGGLVFTQDTAATNANKTSELSEVARLDKYIDESDALMILVDSWSIQNKGPRTAAADNELNLILANIETWLSSHKDRRLALALVLTKCDAVPFDSREQFSGRVSTVFKKISMLSQLYPERLRAAPIPVSVLGRSSASNLTTTDKDGVLEHKVTISGDPEPFRVHEPILYCIKCVLEQLQQNLAHEIETVSRVLETSAVNSSISNDIASYFRGELSHRKRASLSYATLQNLRRNLTQLESSLRPLTIRVAHIKELSHETVLLDI